MTECLLFSNFKEEECSLRAMYGSKRIKFVVSFLLVMTLLFSSLTSFAEITNNKEIRRNLLNEKLAVEVLERFNNGKEKIEVLVKLKEQADVESISNKATLESNSLRLDDYNVRLAVREDVVEALERTSE